MHDTQLFEVPTEPARADRRLERLRISDDYEPSTGCRGGRFLFGLATIATVGAAALAWDRRSVAPWSPRSAAVSLAPTTVVIPDAPSHELVAAGGYAVTHSKIHLGSQLTGKIKKLSVGKGDRVKAGDLIAELENESYQIEVTRTRADADLAKANADRYRKHIDRMSDTLRPPVDLEGRARGGSPPGRYQRPLPPGRRGSPRRGRVRIQQDLHPIADLGDLS